MLDGEMCLYMQNSSDLCCLICRGAVLLYRSIWRTCSLPADGAQQQCKCQQCF